MTTDDPIETRLRDIDEWWTSDMEKEIGSGALEDIQWLAALVRRYRRALRTIGPDSVPVLEPGDADCRWCGGYVESPDIEDHSLECPWRIAREALEAAQLNKLLDVAFENQEVPEEGS